MNYYTLHTPTGRIDVTKEVFEAVEHALADLNKENSGLRVKDHVCGDSCASELKAANANAAHWKERCTILEEANRAGREKIVALANDVGRLMERLRGAEKERDVATKQAFDVLKRLTNAETMLRELTCCCPVNEMEADVLKAIRKPRG